MIWTTRGDMSEMVTAVTAMATATTAGARAQTLARGLDVLELLCAAQQPQSVAAVASALELPRSVVYRLLRTLEDYAVVHRGQHGYGPGPGLRRLVEEAEAPQRRMATPVLQGVVDDLGATAFLVVAEGGLCITTACVEARGDGANLVQRPGTAHPLTRGAPGLALLVALGDTMGPEALGALAGDRLGDVEAARARGWAYSHDEVVATLKSVAVPVRGAVGWPAALAVVYLGEPFTQDEAGRRLQAAARELGAGLRG